MDDIPEDVSNKKYVSAPRPDASTPQLQGNLMSDDIGVDHLRREEEVVSKQEVDRPQSSMERTEIQSQKQEKIKEVKTKKHNSEGKRVRLEKYLKKRKQYFIEVQYPRLYAIFYDVYNFELVGYKPLDNVLKILILITALVIVVIFVIILAQSIRLAL